MFHWMERKLKFANQRRKRNSLRLPDQSVSLELDKNVSYLKDIFKKSSDIVFHSFFIGIDKRVEAALVSVDGLYDKTEIHEHVLQPLQNYEFQQKGKEALNQLDRTLLQIQSVQKMTGMEQSIDLLLKGDSLLFVDGISKVYIIGARAWEMRSIDEPVTETVVRGPREGFVETLRTNTSMIRRKIHHPNLQIQQITLGNITKTDVAIVYIDTIVSTEILGEVKRRLQRIEMDGILESGYIEELIEDAPFSPFPTVANTERPDVVASRILEGRVAIIVEGTPTVLVVPHLMFESFQSAEDYYSRPYYSSFVRILRFLGFMVSTLAPAFYVASQDYHKEIFPSELLITVAASREGVPFPLIIEVFLLLITFEWLREAGIRMPKPIGQAVSIVGALILGEAAVNAGFVGAPTVIIVAVSAITSFMVASMADTAAILRLVYLIAAAILGFYGVMLAVSFFLLHTASLRSFGIPYMSPLMPLSPPEWRDFLVRAPLWTLNRRPESLRPMEEIKQESDQKPHPPK